MVNQKCQSSTIQNNRRVEFVIRLKVQDTCTLSKGKEIRHTLSVK